MHLANLLHSKIVVLGPRLPGGDMNQDKLETVTLVGIDAAGIWIESEDAANRIADRYRVKPASPTAFFIPFTQITTIVASLEAAHAPMAVAAEPPPSGDRTPPAAKREPDQRQQETGGPASASDPSRTC